MKNSCFNLWKKYDNNMNLYKYYFDLSIKIIMWYSSVVGAIFAFFIANQSLKYIEYILIIPIFLSLILFALSSSFTQLLNVIEKRFIDLSKKLGMSTYPTTIALILIIRCCSLIFISIAVGLTIIFLLSL